MYRVFRGSRCQTRCKTMVFQLESRFYTVLGSATPNLRDTFIDFLRKSRFYDVNGISSYKNNAFYASFCYSLSNVSRFFAFLGGNRGMYRVFGCFSSPFFLFSKGILCKSIIFDPRPLSSTRPREAGAPKIIDFL